jgi:hypothetical protein
MRYSPARYRPVRFCFSELIAPKRHWAASRHGWPSSTTSTKPGKPFKLIPGNMQHAAVDLT